MSSINRDTAISKFESEANFQAKKPVYAQWWDEKAKLINVELQFSDIYAVSVVTLSHLTINYTADYLVRLFP